jgi:hypothetical protein
MPKTARARGASPPAGAALARAIRDCLPGRVRQERDSIRYVTLSVTHVNGAVTCSFRHGRACPGHPDHVGKAGLDQARCPPKASEATPFCEGLCAGMTGQRLPQKIGGSGARPGTISGNTAL